MSDEQDFITRFEAFARSKPAEERYSRLSSNACALAQFGLLGLALDNCEGFGVPRSVFHATVFQIPATFGALADRLAALRAAATKAREQGR